MGKFLVTSGSYFEPFTYDELIKPLEATQQRHDAAQESFDVMNERTSALKEYISNNEGDALAKRLYDNYMDKLVSFQNNLYNNGITPQTKRDLTAARSAFASDIARLQQAIQQSQNISSAYNERRQTHPDLVASDDPSAGGLDNFLRDPNYGKDYYTYSGNQFAKEVESGAKARTAELYRVLKDQDRHIPGYIIRIEQQGFTNKEADNAYNAAVEALATGDRSFKNLTEPEKLLANSFISNVDATGAQTKLNQKEFNRLLNYGRIGLSSVVGPVAPRYLSDPMASIKAKKAPADNEAQNNSYILNRTLENITTNGYKKMAKIVSRAEEQYAEPQVLKRPDGTVLQVNTPWEMAREVYGSPQREEIRDKYKIDIARLPYGISIFNSSLKGQYTDESGKVHELTVKLLMPNNHEYGIGAPATPDIGGNYAAYSNGKLDKEISKEINTALSKHSQYMHDYKDANPQLDLEKISINPKLQMKLIEQNALDYDLNDDDLRDVLYTKNKQYEAAPTVIVGTGSGSDYLRSDITDSIFDSYNRHSAEGNMSKGSVYSFREVKKGEAPLNKKGIINIYDVFGKPSGKNSNANPTGSVSSMTISPYDVAAETSPTVRFSTTGQSGKVFTADLSMLGTITVNAFNTPVYRNNDNTAMLSTIDVVKYMMQPIVNPQNIIKMTDKQAQDYMENIYTFISQNPNAMNYLPVYNDEEGTYKVDAKDIVRNQYLQEQLYNAADAFLNSAARRANDIININHQQHVSNSNAKAQYFEN